MDGQIEMDGYEERKTKKEGKNGKTEYLYHSKTV
jgi:hypothetical protein